MSWPGLCGRLAHDPVAVAAAPVHLFGAVPPPASLDRSLVDFTPGAYQNTIYPNCTFASMTNAARGVAYLNGYELDVNPDTVPAGYASCVGCANTPAAIEATDGAVMLDVIAWQGRGGFDIGPQKLTARSGTIALTKSALASAMSRLGLPWCGLVLRERDMDTSSPSSLLDVQPGRDDGAIVGRHAVPFWTYAGLYDDSRVYYGTWGYWQAATWAWVRARIEEAWGLVWRQLARADGTFYAGVTADGLIAELA